MSVRDVLKLAEYAGLTDQQSLDHLLEVIDLRTNSTAYTWSGLSEELLAAGISPTLLVGLDSLLGALPIGATMLDKLLTSGGVDFSLAGIRGQIAANLGQPITADQTTILQACLQIGVPTGPRWESYGPLIAAEPTLQDIADARATIASEALWEWLDVTVNAVRTQVSAGTVLTRQQAADAVLALVEAP